MFLTLAEVVLHDAMGLIRLAPPWQAFSNVNQHIASPTAIEPRRSVAGSRDAFIRTNDYGLSIELLRLYLIIFVQSNGVSFIND